MAKVSYSGGSKVGWLKTSVPMAKLTISPDLLSIGGIGTYRFTPEQVVSFEPYQSGWLRGVHVRHNRPDYPERITFYQLNGDADLTPLIEMAGFVPRGVPRLAAQGFPLRWWFVSLVVLATLAIFWFDANHPHARPFEFGLGARLGTPLLFVLSTAIKLSSGLQHSILRKDHVLGEFAQRST